MAVPRIMPIWVMAGVVMVGDCDTLGDDGVRRLNRLGQTVVEHLDRAVGPQFDVGRLQVAVNDPLLVCGFEGLGDLLRDGACLIDGDGTSARSGPREGRGPRPVP